MESLKRLEEVAKECLKELKSMDSKVSITEGNLAFLESKKIAVTTEIADLEAKKTAVMASIGTAEREARDQIDTRVRELRLKEEQFLADRANLKTKTYELESAKTEAEAAREKYAALYAEYLTKAQEMEDKKQAILAAAGK